jgi:hypothetical protein
MEGPTGQELARSRNDVCSCSNPDFVQLQLADFKPKTLTAQPLRLRRLFLRAGREIWPAGVPLCNVHGGFKHPTENGRETDCRTCSNTA